MDAECSSILSEILEWDQQKATRVLDEMTFDAACMDLILFNKFDFIHIKYNLGLDNLKWLRCALLGNMKECGIPNLPITISQYFEEWDRYLTFDKTLEKPTKKHIKMANKVELMIDEQERIAEEAYESALASAKAKGDNPGLIAHNAKYEALLAVVCPKKRKATTDDDESIDEPLKKMKL